MSLLREIQTSAVSETTEIATVLRECRILASRLKHNDLKKWVEHELDGYPSEAELPDYRIMSCDSFGHFSGPFGGGLRNASIPLICLPEEWRNPLAKVAFTQGVSSLQDLVRSNEDGILRIMWPADIYPHLNGQIYQGMNLMQAWKAIPKNCVVGILDAVRNKVLNFALEIEESNPDAGEAAPGSMPVPQEKVSQIFNTNIYGNVGNVASGHDISQVATVSIQQGDFRSLEAFLEKQGVSKEDLRDLDSAVQAEPDVVGGKFGKRVSSWIGKMVQKSAEGVWKITTDVAAKLIAEALKAYYGF